MLQRVSEPRVAILLSTYNGERFLREQLDSILAQSHEGWTLYWRDDGSTDGTVPILNDFTRSAGQGRCIRIGGNDGRLRPTASFMTLLRQVKDGLGEGDLVAFADQDDVWLPQKLARGVAALTDSDAVADIPRLYCARQMLVDGALRPLGVSHGLQRSTVFPAALTQNVTTGCTIMLDRRAARLVADSDPAPATLHDWWCYLVVTAAGGRVIDDSEPVVLYRQHGGNLVGAPPSMWRRGIAALRRGPSVFMTVMRQHAATLLAQPHLLSPTALAEVQAIDRALRGGPIQRLAALRRSGMRRQTGLETALFYVWFLFG